MTRWMWILRRGTLWLFWDITVRESLHLPSILTGYYCPRKGRSGFRIWIRRRISISGMCARRQEWCSRTRITRLSEILWRKMWALVRKTWVCLPRKSGVGWMRAWRPWGWVLTGWNPRISSPEDKSRGWR